MKFIKIGALSTSELQYIAQQENVDGWEEMSRKELIDCVEEIYEDNVNLNTFARPKHFTSIPKVSPSLIQDFPRYENLPKQYPETVIYLIQRDPSWGYVFWSICRTDQEKLEERYGAFQTIIRVLSYDNSGKRKSIYDFHVGFNDLQWTVNFPESGKEYQVQLLAMTNDGKEHEVAVSQKVKIASNSLLKQESYSRKDEILLLSSLVTKGGKPIYNKHVSRIIEKICGAKGIQND